MKTDRRQIHNETKKWNNNTEYLSRLVLVYFSQEGELFEVDACMFVQSAIA